MCYQHWMNTWYLLSGLGKQVAKWALLLVIVLAGLAPPSRAQEQVLDRVVAQVNNRPVLISDVNTYLSRMLSKISSSESQSDNTPTRERIIQQLIDEELIQQEAERKNIQVSPEEIERALEELKKNNHMNTSQLVLALAKEGIPFQQFCNEMKRELRKSLIIRMEVINRIVINEAMIQGAFEELKNKYPKGQKCRVEQIFQPFKSDVTDEEKKALRLQMNEILAQIQKEDNFHLVVKNYVKSSAPPHYGDMGWIQLKDMAKPLADVVRKLKKGEISGLIESALGLHIIKVVDIEDEAGPNLDELKESLRKELFEKEFQKRFKAWIKSLRDAAHIEIRR